MTYYSSFDHVIHSGSGLYCKALKVKWYNDARTCTEVAGDGRSRPFWADVAPLLSGFNHTIIEVSSSMKPMPVESTLYISPRTICRAISGDRTRIGMSGI